MKPYYIVLIVLALATPTVFWLSEFIRSRIQRLPMRGLNKMWLPIGVGILSTWLCYTVGSQIYLSTKVSELMASYQSEKHVTNEEVAKLTQLAGWSPTAVGLSMKPEELEQYARRNGLHLKAQP